MSHSRPSPPLRVLPPLPVDDETDPQNRSQSINAPDREHEEGERAAATKRLRTPTFDEIFRDQLTFIWRCLAGFGVRDADLQDQAQEVLMVIHRRLVDFDGISLRGWLYGICQRVAAAYRRKAWVRRERLASSPYLRSNGQEALTFEGADADARRLELELIQALEKLDEDKRTVFVLYEIEELTLQEIADALACPLQTVYSRLRAARKHVLAAFATPVGANHGD